ncbi:MAG: L-lactate permease [Gemmatimonadetes bacterium]|nr:L-lactate permease [Gemmatimonadota bacterium]
MGVSAFVATLPLVTVLGLLGIARKSGLVAAGSGLLVAALLAAFVWRMPLNLAGWSIGFGFATAAWSILWLVFNALWLYNLSVRAGSFNRLREWIELRASGDPCVQAVLVAFCFGALLEGSAGFGAPVAITAFLLVGVGFQPKKAVLVSLLANTAPVAFGSVGVPIVALASVTGLDVMRLGAEVGRQLPLLSILLPAYLALVVGGTRGLRRTWPAVVIAGVSFAATQFFVSNYWGPYATDVLSALAAIVATTTLLRVWTPAPLVMADAFSPNERDVSADPSTSLGMTPPVIPSERSESRDLHAGSDLEIPARAALPLRDVIHGMLPWLVLSLVVVVWTHFEVFKKGQIPMPIPSLHNGVIISLYGKPYAAMFNFQPFATGTAVLVTTLISALLLRVRPALLLQCAAETLRQLRLPSVVVFFIVGMAFLFNYSGMVYTLGAALAATGVFFPLVSSFLGWVACFLTGSDTSSNFLFGNLQVAAAQQLHLNPVLLAATNSSGAVAGKMISPQNIAIGVSTVGLVGKEGEVLRSTFWHSVLFATFIGGVALVQAYLLPWTVP